MTNGKAKRPDFTVSSDTLKIESLLRELKEGEVLEYETMTKAIGRNIRKEASYCLVSARRRLLVEDIYTANVRGVGVMRGTSSDTIQACRRETHDRVNSRLRQGKRYLNVAANNFAKLTAEEKTSVVLQGTLISLHESINKDRSSKRLEGAIIASNTTSGPIPIPNFKAMEVIQKEGE